MKSLDQFMRDEREAGSPCRLAVSLLASGEFRARLSFAPGMETVSGDGATVADALEQLENFLNFGVR